MKKLCQPFAVATATGTKAYQVVTGAKAEVRDMAIDNTTAGALTFTAHIVPKDGSVAADNMMFPAVNVPANTLAHWEGVQVMDEGDYIQAIGSGAGLTMHISGEEFKQ